MAFVCASKICNDSVEKLKAVVRRLQAARAPSLFRNAPPDAVVIRELKAMLTSDGARKLLAHAPDNLFAQVIRRAEAVVAEGAPTATQSIGSGNSWTTTT